MMEENEPAKTFVITGSTSGIGLAAAETLVRQGADLIGVGRSPERCQQAEKRLRAIRPGAEVHYFVADLSLVHEVNGLADRIGTFLESQATPALDGLVNNAGIFTYWLTLTPEGVESQWAVNHLAAFGLSLRLLSYLKAAPAARVVTVSSGSHTMGRIRWDDPQLLLHYNGLQAYANTKLANILFSYEFNRRIGAGSGVRALAADPGLVKTDIGLKGTPALVRWVWKMRRAGGISAVESGKGIAALATEPGLQNSAEIYWQHGQPKRTSPAAQDPDSARRLWELSARMCGIGQEMSRDG